MRSFSEFTEDEIRRIELAEIRLVALRKFRTALATNDDESIVRSYSRELDGYSKVLDGERQRLAAAQRRVDALLRFRTALMTELDEQIVANYDPVLDNYPKILPAEWRRLDTARQRYEIKQRIAEALAQGEVEQALKLEHGSPVPISDFDLSVAKSKFVSQRDPKNLVAHLNAGQLSLEWEWPESDLIDTVAIAWRTDGFPRQPEQPDTQVYYALRGSGEKRGWFRHTVGPVDRLYIQLFGALRDTGPLGLQSWHYSNGREPSSRRLAGPPTTINYRLNGNTGNQKELEIRTADGSPLPELVIVRQQGAMPMGVNEGQEVDRVGGIYGQTTNRVLVPLPVDRWPPQSILRVFPLKPDDSDRLTIVGEFGLGLKVN